MKKMKLEWIQNGKIIDYKELSNLYKIAPLGNKPPEMLEKVFNRGEIR